MDYIKIHKDDNVATLLKDCQKGEIVDNIMLLDSIQNGHKFALKDILQGSNIIKYGETIGRASKNIKQGSHVHIHNIEGIRGRGDKEME